MSQVFAFELSVAGTEWKSIINHVSRGKAKADYWRDVNECWNVPFTAIRCRKVGEPFTSEDFRRNAEYRGLPNARCGQRVKVGEDCGVIVGHNSSANFDVLFDDGSRYAGLILNVHPGGCEIVKER